MSVIGSPLRARGGRAAALPHGHGAELTWAAVALLCQLVVVAWPRWQTGSFFLAWIALALIYGLRAWDLRTTLLVLAFVTLTSAAAVSIDVITTHQDWTLVLKVPLMAMLFLVMVWHSRGRVDTLRASERHAAELHATLQRQERFLHDASHELKTPVTIARGHLELLRGDGRHEVEVALDELRRIDAILGQLLLLATAGHPNFLKVQPVELDSFLEDVFMRWSDVAPRSWRLGPVVRGTIEADPDRLRTALDALLDNAIKYSDEHSAIELRAHWSGEDQVVILVEDEGIGIPREAIGRIFARFGRADTARTRSTGGVGLGLAIVEAIAEHHGGHCSVRSGPHGSVFALHLPLSAASSATAAEVADSPLASSLYDL
jgi:signal transduction histidine kinase